MKNTDLHVTILESITNRDAASTKKKYLSKYWVLAVLKVLE